MPSLKCINHDQKDLHTQPFLKKDGPLLTFVNTNNGSCSLHNNLAILQSASTLIHLLKKSVRTVQKYIYQLRKITIQAATYDLTDVERLNYSNSFNNTLIALNKHAHNVSFCGIPILIGETGRAAKILTPNEANINSLKLKTDSALKEGSYNLILEVNSSRNPHCFTIKLMLDNHLIAKEETNYQRLNPDLVFNLNGLEVSFKNMDTDKLLDAKIGLVNDAQLISASIVSPLYPGKYKILLIETPVGYQVYLGRFYSNLKKLQTDVGGLHLKFSKNLSLNPLYDGKGLSEIIVQHQSLISPILIGNWLLPLELQFNLYRELFRIQVLPLLAEALTADAFGSIKSVADLNVKRGFDPAINLEVLETIDLNLNIYDKNLSTYLGFIQNAFSALTKNFSDTNPELLLENLANKLNTISLNSVIKPLKD